MYLVQGFYSIMAVSDFKIRYHDRRKWVQAEYWANFSHDDIQRESVGHLKQDNVVRLDKKKR